MLCSGGVLWVGFIWGTHILSSVWSSSAYFLFVFCFHFGFWFGWFGFFWGVCLEALIGWSSYQVVRLTSEWGLAILNFCWIDAFLSSVSFSLGKEL